MNRLGKKCHKTSGRDFFDSHCRPTSWVFVRRDVHNTPWSVDLSVSITTFTVKRRWFILNGV